MKLRVSITPHPPNKARIVIVNRIGSTALMNQDLLLPARRILHIDASSKDGELGSGGIIYTPIKIDCAGANIVADGTPM